MRKRFIATLSLKIDVPLWVFVLILVATGVQIGAFIAIVADAC